MIRFAACCLRRGVVPSLVVAVLDARPKLDLEGLVRHQRQSSRGRV